MEKFRKVLSVLIQIYKYLSFGKYLFIPMLLAGQAPSPCPGGQYVVFWDSVGGPIIKGEKMTYLYFRIPLSSVRQAEDSSHYFIQHPAVDNHCKVVETKLEDKKKVVQEVKEGRAKLLLCLKYAEGKTDGVWHLVPDREGSPTDE